MSRPEPAGGVRERTDRGGPVEPPDRSDDGGGRRPERAAPDPSEPPRPRLAREAEELGPWFHNLHLPGGVETAPDHFLGDFPAYKWDEVAPHLPEDLEGWTVLDVGCNAGYYSFELARRGAHVTGVDHDERYLRQARWAAPHLGLEDRTEFLNRGVYEIGRSEERWDLVLFLGVLYHLRYPLLGLDAVARRTRRLMVFQTLMAPGEAVREETHGLGLEDREVLAEEGWPKLSFLEHPFESDPTNWWAPNRAAVEAMLRSAGMEVVEHAAHDVWVCRPHPERRRGWMSDEEMAAALGLRSRVPRGRSS